MRDYGKISTSIWNSRKFQGLTSDDARLAYLYLHTCPSVNSIGCFVLKDGYAADDLGWEKERYQRAIEALSIALLIGFHRPESLIRIIDFLKHDPFTNKNHAAGAIKLANALPECDEKLSLFIDITQQKFIENLLGQNRAIEGLSNGYRTPEPEPEPKKDSSGVQCSADARDESENPDPGDDLQPTHFPADPAMDQLYDDVLKAAGLARGRMIPSGWLPPASTLHIARWRTLGITEAEIIAGVRNSQARYSDPPTSPKAYDHIMRQIAAAKQQPALTIPQGGNHVIRSEQSKSAAEREDRIRLAAIRGST